MKIKKYLFGVFLCLGVIAAILNRTGNRWKAKHVTLPATIQNWDRPSPQDRSSFQQGMDSIRANGTLQKQFDSLMRARPGFADTIRTLEELYPRK